MPLLLWVSQTVLQNTLLHPSGKMKRNLSAEEWVSHRLLQLVYFVHETVYSIVSTTERWEMEA